MYTTGPPPPGAGPGAGQLRIGAMARRLFAGPPAIASRPEHLPHLSGYLSDLVRPFRLRLRDRVAGEAGGHSYGEMAAALLRELVSPDRPVGVVVLAFAIPDVRPGRATATYLSHLCPGSPLAFAICDQGAAAAYTGLRLLGEYARTGDCRRGLLLVVEQAGLSYDAGLPVDLPAAHTAVGLRCEESGPAAVRSVRQHADVAPERVAGLILAEWAAAAAGGRDVTLIADARLAGELVGSPVAGQVRVAPAGRPHTGGWWELAGPGWPAGHRVLVTSYDRPLRYLCMSTVDLQLAGSAAGSETAGQH